MKLEKALYDEAWKSYMKTCSYKFCLSRATFIINASNCLIQTLENMSFYCHILRHSRVLVFSRNSSRLSINVHHLDPPLIIFSEKQSWENNMTKTKIMHVQAWVYI